jgi:ubiquinone/menaquinone biosynthesis C-methylase UbiE
MAPENRLLGEHALCLNAGDGAQGGGDGPRAVATGRGMMTGMKTSDHLRENYENYYEEGDSEWRRLCAVGKADTIVSLCNGLPRGSVLEIGAGEGSILQRLSGLAFGEKLYAIEISPSGVAAINKKRIPNLVECKLFDGYYVPYDDDRFDLAVLSHVIEHVEHPRQLLYEASRVAKYVFIEVPLEDTARLPDDFAFHPVGHINFYSRKAIRRLVQSCNLRVLGEIVRTPAKGAYSYQWGRVGLMKYYVKQALLHFLPGLATRLSTYHGALVCEKAGQVRSSQGEPSSEFKGSSRLRYLR